VRGLAEFTTGVREFDLAQAAAEKNIELQTALAQAQLGSAERGASRQAVAIQQSSAAQASAACFSAGTLVEMEGGSEKDISKIIVGDILANGSLVSTVVQAMSEDFYSYKGIEVTGSHAVLEDGTWIRIKDSSLATKVEGRKLCYNLGTADHKIIINKETYADFFETDYYEYVTESESLEILNGNFIVNEQPAV
jgi:hypothetical protein